MADPVRFKDAVKMVAKIMKTAKAKHIGTIADGAIHLQKWVVNGRGVIVEITDEGDVNHFIVSETKMWIEMLSEMLALSKKARP